MKSGKFLMGSALLMLALPAFAQILPISEQEQNLLGIRSETVTAVDQGDAGEITMRVAFAPDGEWAIKHHCPVFYSVYLCRRVTR